MSRDLIEAGLGWSYRPRRVRELIEDPETATVVGRARLAIAGFGMMGFEDERAHLVLLAVHPAWQRQGLARRIIDWLIGSARVAGVASVHVELRAHNVAALALYRAMGFTETAQFPGYYRGRESAILMVRTLRPPNAPPR